MSVSIQTDNPENIAAYSITITGSITNNVLTVPLINTGQAIFVI